MDRRGELGRAKSSKVWFLSGITGVATWKSGQEDPQFPLPNCNIRDLQKRVEESGGMWYIKFTMWGEDTCSWANISIRLIQKAG